MATLKRPTLASKLSYANLRKKISACSGDNTGVVAAADQAISPDSTSTVFPVINPRDNPVGSDSQENRVVEILITSVGSTARTKLNSRSLPSETPKTWMEWNKAYAAGLIDFSDPPSKPDSLAFEEQYYYTLCGDYKAPRDPRVERSRQLALQSLGILEFKREALSVEASVPISIKKARYDDGTFLKLVEKSKNLFGVRFCAVNLVDGDFVVPEMGERLPRGATVCAHSLLAATSGSTTKGMYILDLKTDWRFQGPQHSGFYASHPIYAPAHFGDPSATPEVVALLCIMDPVTRNIFTEEERKGLEDLALEAGAEFSRIFDNNQKAAEVFLIETESETMNNSEKGINDRLRSNSLTSIPPPYTLDGTFKALPSVATTLLCPTFPRRHRSRAGFSPTTITSAPESLKSVLNLATSLLAGSLDLDFVYLLSIDLAIECDPARSLQFLSSHNSPIPPPLFDLQLHSQPILSPQSILLFNTSEDLQPIEGHFSTGLLDRVGLIGTKGYVLGGFSEDPRKILDRQDLLFFSNFAHDLRKHIACL